MRPFRFGFQVRQQTAGELRATAREAEAAGFDVISTWDHVVDGWAPLSPLLAMADSTTRLRICPLVLNNDFHHPVHLARELACIDHLTGGRLEVGIGAGHAFTEYAAQTDRLDNTVAYIRAEAGARDVELNALVQRVVVTDDRRTAARELIGTVEGLILEEALATPFLALGTHDEIAEHLLACRARWGISYFTVRDIPAFAPVVERLRPFENSTRR